MVKTIQEQIEVMQHYANGGEIELLITEDGYSEWYSENEPSWNWKSNDYRIKESKEELIIEKWLTYNKMYDTYSIVETSKIDTMMSSVIQKVKLIESYKVEL